MAVQVFQALRCDGLARVDFFYEEDGRGLLVQRDQHDARLHPDLDVSQAVAGHRVGYPALIDELVHLALDRHGRRRRRTDH